MMNKMHVAERRLPIGPRGRNWRGNHPRNSEDSDRRSTWGWGKRDAAGLPVGLEVQAPTPEARYRRHCCERRPVAISGYLDFHLAMARVENLRARTVPRIRRAAAFGSWRSYPSDPLRSRLCRGAEEPD